MRSKHFRRFLLALIFVVLTPFILLEGVSIYSYLRFALLPSATKQVLDFAGLPRDTKLPTRDPKATDAYNTDYQQVQNGLTQRFPAGTSKQEIEQFTTINGCRGGTDKIICSFEGVWYAPGSSEYFSPIGFLFGCSDTVYVTFSFDAGNKLAGIEITGVTNCV